VDSTNKDTQNIVDEHRKMVVMTGNISDFQIENLKQWPFVVFGEDLKESKVDYDFVQGKEGDLCAGSVNFDFNFKKEPKEITKGLDFLTHCTRYLFWADTEVTFTNKGKKWPKTKA
jgi:hypothetical protein